MSNSPTRKARRRSATATHRPATKRRRSRHDGLVAVDLFSGFGGFTRGVELAGFTTILAANHDEYKTLVHEANHPHAEHWIADLVDPEAADYHDVRLLPKGDILLAGVSCVNHSKANTIKAYLEGLTLFGLDDPDYEERVTRSERDRATANCVLHYAERHHPMLILVECTTELTSWGPLVPGKKYGDGSTHRWWLKQFGNIGYRHKVLYLNSMFFGVPQSRNRGFWVFWDKSLPEPDLEHRPVARCHRCEDDVEAKWTWRTGIPPTGTVSYGKQYDYRCPRCRNEVVPPMTPSLAALDLSDLGTRIGDRDKPLAPATMARAERCRQRFADFPAVLMPAKAVHGSPRHPWQPMATQTSQRETGILSTGAIIAAAGNTYERPGSDCRTRGLNEPLWTQPATNTTGVLTPGASIATGQVFAAHRHNGDGQHITKPMDTVTTTHEKAMLLAVDNYQSSPRGVNEPLPTQVGSETLALVSSGVVPFRQNTLPTSHGEAMPTVTADQIPGLLTAAGTIKNNGAIHEAGYRSHPVSDPLGTIVASGAPQSLLFSGWTEHASRAENGAASVLMAEWRARLVDLPLEDCYFRMMRAYEIGRGCGFDVDFGDHKGDFIVWGSARDQTNGFGNAVSPPVGEWIGRRLRSCLHPEVAT